MTGDMEAWSLLWEFIGMGTAIAWICHMAGFATSGKRVSSVVKLD